MSTFKIETNDITINDDHQACPCKQLPGEKRKRTTDTSPTPLEESSQKLPHCSKWPSGRFRRFVDYLRANVDVTDFARQEHVPVSEVERLFHFTICENAFDLANQTEQWVERDLGCLGKGKEMRSWTVRGIYAKLDRVVGDAVEVISQYKNILIFPWIHLTDADKAYLKAKLPGDQFASLENEGQYIRRRWTKKKIAGELKKILPSQILITTRHEVDLLLSWEDLSESDVFFLRLRISREEMDTLSNRYNTNAK